VFFTIAVAVWANDVPYPPLVLSPTVTLTYPQVDAPEGVATEATVKV